MIVGSLFTGIGGFDLGLERAGMTCKWQVEVDEFCRKVLTKHWPDVPKFGDIKECGAHNLEPVDLICGGWPCQPFSVAGKRRGRKDDRYLWPEMLRIIKALRPTWVIGENVPGIISMELDRVLSEMEAIGYSTLPPLVLPACGVNAPHRRYRVFIVAHAPQQANRQSITTKSARQEPEPRKRDIQGPVADPQNTNRRRSIVPIHQGRGIKEAKRPGYWDDSELLVGADSKVRRIKPGIQLLVDGVPGRLAQLRGYGNAVLPQVAEFIGRRIIAFERSNHANP